MTIPRLEVITSVERRRRWSREDKERIVAAAVQPGAVASVVARQAGIHSSQLFRWRRQLCGPAQAAPIFAAVAVVPEPVAPSAPQVPTMSGLIEIELADGARLKITGAADPATVSATIMAMTQGRPPR